MCTNDLQGIGFTFFIILSSYALAFWSVIVALYLITNIDITGTALNLCEITKSQPATSWFAFSRR